jgi:hypothetical protein
MESELDKALAKLGENIKNRERASERFDFEDFRVTVTRERGTTNVELQKNGVRSVSEVREDGSVGHTELFGPDGETLSEPTLKAERVSAVAAIVEAGLLTSEE